MPSIPSLLFFLLLETPAAPPDAGGPLALTDYARAFQRLDPGVSPRP